MRAIRAEADSNPSHWALARPLLECRHLARQWRVVVAAAPCTGLAAAMWVAGPATQRGLQRSSLLRRTTPATRALQPQQIMRPLPPPPPPAATYHVNVPFTHSRLELRFQVHSLAVPELHTIHDYFAAYPTR
jgi:hypothetical protein